MPIDYKDTSTQVSQRDVFARNLLARKYRGFLDSRILTELEASCSILDVGCGEGILLEKLAARYPGKRLAGVDLSEENVSICKGMGLDVMLSDASDLKVPSSSFDACVMMSVLEHVVDPRAALREAWRVLKPAGRLLVLLPNDGFFKLARYVFLRFKEAREDYGHVSEWDPARTREELAAAGFRVVKARNLPGPFWSLSLHHLCIGMKSSPDPEQGCGSREGDMQSPAVGS
jgi:2-polyprenyl-3-methyl-5-hydroxy-6-metoxy-1,4-benzoquinol methylase